MEKQILPAETGILAGDIARSQIKTQVQVARKTYHWRDNVGLGAQYLYLIIMAVFALFPIYFVVQASLSSTQALYTTNLTLFPPHPTFDNYKYVWGNLPFPQWLWNSFEVNALATIIGLASATTGAYALSRFRFNGRQATLSLMLALQAFPGLLALYAYYNILQFLHLDGTIVGLSIIYAAGSIVFGVWNIKGYFDTIPKELEEAALVDGASYFRTFWQVILPLATPSIAVSALFMFIGGWNEFALAKLILNPFPNSLTVPVGLFNLQDSHYSPWGYFAAASVIVSVPLMALFLWLQTFLRSGLTIGSVKG